MNEIDTRRRTHADKRMAIRRLLADPVWRGRSSRWIAQEAGVTGEMVERVRRAAACDGVVDEAAMEQDFVASLRAQGARVVQQQHCAVGIADVVDEEWCYEIKLSGDDLFKAVGQALMYAKCLGRKPCVVLGSPARPGHAEVAESIGVRIVVLR